MKPRPTRPWIVRELIVRSPASITTSEPLTWNGLGLMSSPWLSEWIEYSHGTATRFRTRPPGVVDGPIGAGALNLPIACARARALASRPFKFTLTGPHMLAKMLHDRHYRDPERLAHAIADVLAEQVKRIDASQDSSEPTRP